MAQLIREDIAALIRQGIRAAQAAGDLPAFDLPEIPIERSKVAAHGDYSSGISMALARLAKTKPLEIAQRIVAHLPAAEMVSKAEAVLPGYINFALADTWLAAQIETILAQGEAWGSVDVGHGERTQVEFVSANPNGPLHIGSTRNAVIGDALASVLQAAGYAVEREYYVNDAGSQVRRFGESIWARYAQSLGQDVPFPEGGYQGEYITELGQQLAAESGRRYLEMDQREAARLIADWAMERMLKNIKADLADLNIHFDTWRHERFFYEQGLFDKVLTMLRERGYIVTYHDAVWFRHPELDKDAVLIRSPKVIPEPSEQPTYLASDVAYAWDKLVERNFARAIYVWGADHHGDVPRVKMAAKALGLDPDRLIFILYQLVSLKRGGEEVRMSRRAGEFVTLREVIDEVGSDAIRFMLLTRGADSTMDFDLKLAAEQSSENPVYYVQYAHARIASILKKAAAEGFSEKSGLVSLLVTPGDLALIRKMLDLREIIEKCAEDLSPHHLTHYAQDLAATFHTFYRDCRVVSSLPQDVEMTQARLKRVCAAKTVLARTLHLMGMNAPESM
jgi:arginyl-tRNA synthetase